MNINDFIFGSITGVVLGAISVAGVWVFALWHAWSQSDAKRVKLVRKLTRERRERYGIVSRTDNQGHPYNAIVHHSDQTTCRYCGQAWDRNDLVPPMCRTVRVRQFKHKD